eukprot:3310472-Prymnesium_polylepis.1
MSACAMSYGFTAFRVFEPETAMPLVSSSEAMFRFAGVNAMYALATGAGSLVSTRGSSTPFASRATV